MSSLYEISIYKVIASELILHLSRQICDFPGYLLTCYRWFPSMSEPLSGKYLEDSVLLSFSAYFVDTRELRWSINYMGEAKLRHKTLTWSWATWRRGFEDTQWFKKILTPEILKEECAEKSNLAKNESINVKNFRKP